MHQWKTINFFHPSYVTKLTTISLYLDFFWFINKLIIRQQKAKAMIFEITKWKQGWLTKNLIKKIKI